MAAMAAIFGGGWMGGVGPIDCVVERSGMNELEGWMEE